MSLPQDLKQLADTLSCYHTQELEPLLELCSFHRWWKPMALYPYPLVRQNCSKALPYHLDRQLSAKGVSSTTDRA